MLSLRDLSVRVGSRDVLQSISLDFPLNSLTCILGKNGSGKSSLSLSVMGHPRYEITQGGVFIGDENISQLPPDERAARGIFLALQNIPEIPGVRLIEYLRTIYNAHLARTSATTPALTPFVFKRFIAPIVSQVGVPLEFLDRDLNVGFSGGEKRKIELLQMRLLSPKYIFLDEIDSGLDLDALRAVGDMIRSVRGPDIACVVITHNPDFIRKLEPDTIVVIENGRITEIGGIEVLNHIEASGFVSMR